MTRDSSNIRKKLQRNFLFYGTSRARLVAFVFGLGVALVSPGVLQAGPIFIGPSEYLAFDNSVSGAGTAVSPFNDVIFQEFYLETFEDGALNTPSVTGNGGTFSGGPTVDSVDVDDGSIDGSGLNGTSYVVSITAGSNPQITFEFSILPGTGELPTHVGLVWTDGLPEDITVTFEAFDELGNSLGTIVASGFPDGVNTGTTADDRFFGVIDFGGISEVTIKNSNTQTFGIEVDHLQYGVAGVIPEPTTLALFVMGLAGLGFMMRRRRKGIVPDRAS